MKLSEKKYALPLSEIDRSFIHVAGGKAANLGELLKVAGIHMPDGFCITTESYRKLITVTPSIGEWIDQLSDVYIGDQQAIRRIGENIRNAIQNAPVPRDIEDEITAAIDTVGRNVSYAVRSSATAEDLPTASFAGQHDTYLNITGKASVLKALCKCWASLFTERAIIYRMRNGFDHRKVTLAVVVQKMIFPQAAGILFTADPVTSNRKVCSIDASFGLGEALVSGIVNPDVYKVRAGAILEKKISEKRVAIRASKNGGTFEEDIPPGQRHAQVLNDAQVLDLAHTGRKIEEHFGSPQDIEWCLSDDTFYIVQTRPITTLFPIPEITDRRNHVFLSVGHQQMMTDPMKPLGLSFFRLTSGRPMYEAAGRLFVDVAPDLASPSRREMMVNVLGKSDPLIHGALKAIVERGDFIKTGPDEPVSAGTKPQPNFQAMLGNDPNIVTELISDSEASIRALAESIQAKRGAELLDFIRQDVTDITKRVSDPRNFGAIMTGINAYAWINDHLENWLGEKNVADTLVLSAQNNITAEMGLVLMDVADAIRPYPEIVDYLKNAHGDDFLDNLSKFKGGDDVKKVIDSFLEKFGMRCAGEIDITRPRWRERPSTLLPIILTNIRNFAPGTGKQKFEHGRQEALRKESDVLNQLRALPDGEHKMRQTKDMIGLLRTFMGYREYPKYAIVSRYFIYKKALMNEADRLVSSNIIHDREDIYYLTLDELRDVVQTGLPDYATIETRKADQRSYERLTPPRVMTSDGEVISGVYAVAHHPSGAIAGLPVSSGVVEGRARVIFDMKDAHLDAGDILVTTFTDPSWTPAFVSIKGLVTEVGGLMTHGAVIAREYGLPAVVGVENATRLIKNGQRITVNGSEGWILCH